MENFILRATGIKNSLTFLSRHHWRYKSSFICKLHSQVPRRKSVFSACIWHNPWTTPVWRTCKEKGLFMYCIWEIFKLSLNVESLVKRLKLCPLESALIFIFCSVHWMRFFDPPGWGTYSVQVCPQHSDVDEFWTPITEITGLTIWPLRHQHYFLISTTRWLDTRNNYKKLN